MELWPGGAAVGARKGAGHRSPEEGWTVPAADAAGEVASGLPATASRKRRLPAGVRFGV